MWPFLCMLALVFVAEYGGKIIPERSQEGQDVEEMRAKNMTWERFYLLKELEKWLNERSNCTN